MATTKYRRWRLNCFSLRLLWRLDPILPKVLRMKRNELQNPYTKTPAARPPPRSIISADKNKCNRFFGLCAWAVINFDHAGFLALLRDCFPMLILLCIGLHDRGEKRQRGGEYFSYEQISRMFLGHRRKFYI